MRRKLAWALGIAALLVGLAEVGLAVRCGAGCGDGGVDAVAPLLIAVLGLAGLALARGSVTLVLGVLALPLAVLFGDPLLLVEGALLLGAGMSAAASSGGG